MQESAAPYCGKQVTEHLSFATSLLVWRPVQVDVNLVSDVKARNGVITALSIALSKQEVISATSDRYLTTGEARLSEGAAVLGCVEERRCRSDEKRCAIKRCGDAGALDSSQLLRGGIGTYGHGFVVNEHTSKWTLLGG